MKKTVCCAFALVLLFAGSASFAHEGKLESNGCHEDKQLGGYHCHGGKSSGQSFSSKADMLKKNSGPKSKKATQEIKSVIKGL